MTLGIGRRFVRAAALATTFVLLAGPALAEEADKGGEGGDKPAAPKDLAGVVESARLWVLGIMLALSTLFLILGAARYVIAGGDPGEVERAKHAIKSAMFGYALALLAPALLTVLRGIVGG